MTKIILATSSARSAFLFSVFLAAICFSMFTNDSVSRARPSDEGPSVSSSRPPLANLSLVIGVAQDAVAPLNTLADTLNGRSVCPSNPTAGCDFGLNNSVIRTNDSVIYSYDYSVNGGAEDITLTATAPIGTVWNVLPAFCMAGSTLNSGDGIGTASIIVCKRGIQGVGTAESLPLTLSVLGSTANGTILAAGGSVTGLSSTPATANAPNVVVSAAPHFNLRKTYSNYGSFTFNGVPGYRIDYRVAVEVFDDSTPTAYNPRFGSEALSSPFTFTDNVSQISPNAALQSCVKVVDSTGSSNGNGGTIGCTQSAPGQNISVTITGANTTLSQYVTPPSDNRYLTGTYQIYVFIPASDVTNAPGSSLSTTNVMTDFDPVSTGGQSNFGTLTESLTDNSVARTFTPLGGSFGKSYVKDYNNSNASLVGTLVGSDRFVTPGEIFASQVSLNNNSGAALSNVVLCDIMDNSKYSVIQTPAGTGVVHGFDAATPPTAVEFATGYVNANWMPTSGSGNPTGIRTECSDPSIVWYSDATSVPGGIAAITKFRVRYNSLASGVTSSVRVRLQARDNNFYTSQTIFNGAVLPNFGAWRSDEFNPNFINNTYFPNVYPNGANGSPGARLFLARAIVRIIKETESNNAVNSVATGGTIGYVLKPTLSTVGAANPVQVSIMDVLPVGLSYIVGTGQQNSISFEPQIINCTASTIPDSHCTVAGQQLLVWTLNNQTPNVVISPIIFRAAADLTVANNQTVSNRAIVSSPADPSTETLRSSTRNITGASPSTLLIFKNTSSPQIEVNAPFRYSVSYRNASFVNDFTNLDFIDVLPFNGDASLSFDAGIHQRTPPSIFNGLRTLTTLSATTAGAVWYFTNASPSSINISPKFISNLNPGNGGSIWCSGTASGPGAGCGFTLAQVTAVRMQDTTLFVRNTPIRSFTMVFATSGNQASDRYTNNSSGSAAELALSISSNNVPVIVLESSLSGIVWYDTNGDGVRGTEETGRVVSSSVALSGTDGSGNQVTRSAATAANGSYSFSQLPSGTYTLQFTRPVDYRVSPPDVGTDDTIDSDGNQTTLITGSITLGINDGKTNIDQGFWRLDLGGTAWRDLNRDSLLNNAEYGVPGLTVELLDSLGNIIKSVPTDVGGNYLFTNLDAGDHRVRLSPGTFVSSPVTVQNPNNDVENDNNGAYEFGFITSGAISLAPGTEPTIDHLTGVTTNNTLDLGLSLTPTAAHVTIGGRVVSLGGRGIGRATVTLTDLADGTVKYAVTNPFGFYRFNGIRSGSTVMVNVTAKNTIFEENNHLISVMDDNIDVNFVTNR